MAAYAQAALAGRAYYHHDYYIGRRNVQGLSFGCTVRAWLIRGNGVKHALVDVTSRICLDTVEFYSRERKEHRFGKLYRPFG
jgi:hypothetical protein